MDRLRVMPMPTTFVASSATAFATLAPPPSVAAAFAAAAESAPIAAPIASPTPA